MYYFMTFLIFLFPLTLEGRWADTITTGPHTPTLAGGDPATTRLRASSGERRGALTPHTNKYKESQNSLAPRRIGTGNKLYKSRVE
jgi:hypothetical protein